ncbi:MAG: hypothetical protein NDI94_06040 [Candidatus Woesearchaeota archaeon]|nr:hypothetical protein [Candidatus Woesearchaeota archaeon]
MTMPDLETIAEITAIAGTAFAVGAIAGSAVMGYIQRKVGRKLGYQDALEKVYAVLEDMGLTNVYNRLMLEVETKDLSKEEVKYSTKQIADLNRNGEKGEIEAIISDLVINDNYISGKCYDPTCKEGRLFCIDLQSDMVDYTMDQMKKASVAQFLKGLTDGQTVTLGVAFNKKYHGLAVDYLVTPQGKTTFPSSTWISQDYL